MNARHSGSDERSLPTFLTAVTKSLLNLTLSQFSASGQRRKALASITAVILPFLCKTGKKGNILQLSGRSSLLQLPLQTQILTPSPSTTFKVVSSWGNSRIPLVSSPLQQAAEQSLPQSFSSGVRLPKIAFAFS